MGREDLEAVMQMLWISQIMFNTDFFLESEIDTEDLHEVDAFVEGNRTRQCLNIMMYYKDQKEFAPIIYRIARDYLAIPAISAPSEALFSRVTDIATKERNRLHPSTIKMLAILKSRDIVTDESDISDLTDVFEKVSSGRRLPFRRSMMHQLTMYPPRTTS